MTLVIALGVCPTLWGGRTILSATQNSEIATAANRIAGAEGPSIVRAERLVNWMYENFKWTANEYTSRTVEEILERRKGHCGEMAWVLETLLQAADIRVRVVKEVNIHPRSEERQRDAENLVSERGAAYSVFGYMHNDHRWLEIYDDRGNAWVPADPTLGIFGLSQWVEARVGFGKRPEAAAEMVVPVAVFAVTDNGELLDRTEHYLIDEFESFYGKGLVQLDAWSAWRQGIRALNDPVRSAFTGEKDLHAHSALLEDAERAYLRLEQQFENGANADVRASSPTEPGWIRAFGYAPSSVHSIEIGKFGYPYVTVRVAGKQLTLPFDTGNMVGVSVSTDLFDQLGLTATESYERRNSAGEVVGKLRVADSVDVSMLGRELGATRVYELAHPDLPGLVGPISLGRGHFTIDYGSKKMALVTGPLPDAVVGFNAIPLVRSSRHPRLILVRGTVEGREVLIELDTGKSRTVINPALASESGLKRGRRGVAIKELRIGDLSFGVPSAKEVDQTAIDPDLREPILAGIGSDLLSRFVWTVDYEAGVLWIPEQAKNE